MEFALIALFILIYFAPSIIGNYKHNFISIFFLNLFLGWTLVGWIVAMVWALTKDEQKVIIEKDNTSFKKNNESIGLEHKKCPDCAELIKIEAKVCRYCGLRFD